MSCHACTVDPLRCSEVFRCATCGRVLNSCSYRVGGLDGRDECCNCWETRELGWEDWRVRRAAERGGL